MATAVHARAVPGARNTAPGRSSLPMFAFGKRSASIVARATRKGRAQDVVIPDPDFKLPGALLGIGATFFATESYVPAGVFGVLGAFLAIQATRVQFVFDREGLEVLIKGSEKETENAFVGGRNRWAYKSFVNWELWWPSFPVLVYFKETQTKPEGQIHFFPVIFNGKQLYDVMVERCGNSQNSLPK